MPRKKLNPETALVVAPQEIGNLPATLLADLATLNPLGDLDAEDRPVPHVCFNMRLQINGKWLPRDVFFNVASEEVLGPSIDCVMLTLKKVRRHTTYTEGVGTTLHCRSFDMKEGVTADGEVIECATCPNRQWLNNAKPACSLTYAIVALNLTDMLPIVLKVKGSSLQPCRRYLAKHFTNKLRRRDGSFTDLPLFVHKTRLSLSTPEGTYAVLNFESLGMCSEAEIIAFKTLYDRFLDFRRVDLDVEQPTTENGSGKIDDDQIPDFPAP